MSDFDYLLHRDIKQGKQFDKLIPKTNCKATFLGKGMTDFSVNEMAEMVKKYASQMEKIAQVLNNGSLQQVCTSIHNWCYNHFQYKADNEVQYLRSPSCSWHSRYEGIDCKSYSIIASCILTNLGITHYIRRIKQPTLMPDRWTHVYVVVPIDQETGRLNYGYYVIDGTIATQAEPLFTDKSDLLMNMKHYGLNGAATGLNGTSVTLNDIKGLFSGQWNLSCINGSLNMNHFNQTIANVVPAYDDMFYAVNQSVRYGDSDLIPNINKLFRISLQIKSHSELKAGGNWSSSCSRAAVNAYKDLGQYYYNIVYTGFMQWLKHYFDVTTSTQSAPNNTFEIPVSFGVDSDIAQVQPIIVTHIKPKATTTDVKQFILTPYMANKDNISNFSLTKFLQGITQVAASFKDENPGQSPNIPGNNIDPSTGVPYNNSNKIVTAGAGIGGFVLFAAGAAILFSEMKDKPAKQAVATRPKTAATKSTTRKKSTSNK